MVRCAYCENPLTCDACGAVYVPPSLEHYHALSQPEAPVGCPACEALLVCRWCKTPYDGRGDAPGDGPDAAGP